MALGRISPGQNLTNAISARAWNRAQDAADIVLNARANLAAEPDAFHRLPHFVFVKNFTGTDVPRFGVLGFSDVVVDPSGGTLTGTDFESDSAREFVRRPVLAGVVPQSIHAQKFGVLLEPAAPDAIVRAAVSGVFACRVHKITREHGFASVKPGDPTQLVTRDCGLVQLLWIEGDVGPNRWALGVM